MGDISVWGGTLKTTKTPTDGQIPVGQTSTGDFVLTQSNITFANPLVINVPVTVNGNEIVNGTETVNGDLYVGSASNGKKIYFQDGTYQTTAAFNYSPSTYGTGTVLGNYTGSTSVPVAYSLSSVLDNVFGTTQGAIIYRGASTWSALAPGTSGQYLQTQGSGANPQWVGASPWILVIKPSDQSYTSTAAVADTNLKFTMATNTKYKIRIHIDLFASVVGNGFSITTYGPASPTSIFTSGGYYWSNTLGTAVYDAPTAFSGGNSGTNTAYGLVVSNSVSSPYVSAVFEILVSNGANAGTFGISFGTYTGTGPTTVKAGSYLEYISF